MELLEPGHFGDIPSTPYDDQPRDLQHRNLIPTWQFTSYDGQSASDNHFVSVGTDPLHPVVAIGRLPVVDASEVKAIVDKTIRYMRTPNYGAWRRDVMFITDESDYFKNTSDEIAGTLDAQGFSTHKVYASAEEKDNLAHQSEIKDGLNDGQLLVHFIGHGGRYIWRTGPPDLRKNHDLFTLDDVSGLRNGAVLPLVMSMTCYSAPFDNPTEDSIGERFIREADKGAIAVFAASWRNSPSPQYSKGLIEELIKPGATIGEAIVAGKAKNRDATLVETYNLLGDPALVLERPANGLTLARRVGAFGRSRIELTLPRDGFSGKVDAEWVDAKGNVLHHERFAAIGTRFVVSQPDAALVADAVELRAYAADAGRGFDAMGRLILKAPAPKAAPEELDQTRIPKETATKESATTAPPAAQPSKPAQDAMSSGGFESGQSTGGVDGSAGAPPQSSRNALRK
jgi:hypothetical protein